jgi:biopolymer transport protein ExbD
MPEAGTIARLRRRHGRDRQLLDLTPMVDVALMLVGFLLLSADVVADSAVPVDLPAAATAEDLPTEARRMVVITAGGRILLDDLEVAAEELGALVDAAAVVVVQADREVAHGQVVRVVDALRQAGVAGIYYATEDPARAVEETW